MPNIRLATYDDLPRLKELMAMSGVEVPGIDYSEFTGLVLVAEQDEKVVGFIQMLAGLPYSNLTEMAVDPNYRGQLIGRALLQAAEETLLAAGCPAWTTVTSKEYIADALRDWGAEYTGQLYGFVRVIKHGDC
jgi:ribosomal protein S18 acetylase RimI-like enzyme